MGRITGAGTAFAAIAVAALLPLAAAFLVFPPHGHSLAYNLAWLASFDAQLWSGEPYPRWLDGLWGGAGGPDFFFYAPLPFWVASIVGGIACPPCAPETILAVGGYALLVASGLAFRLFARRFVAPAAATLGAVLYMVLPYHLAINWFARQSLGEFAAYAFLPLIARFLIAMREDGRGGAGFALAVGGLVLSHLPSAVVAAVLVALAGGALAAAGRGDGPSRPAFAARVLAWGAVGTMIGAAYWLPALALLGDVSGHLLYDAYHAWDGWMFLDGRPEPNPGFATVLKVLLAALTAAALAAHWLLAERRRETLAWAVLPVIAAWALMTPVSWALWRHAPVLPMIQFPWRFLMLAEFGAGFALALLAGAALAGGGRRTSGPRLALAAFALPAVLLAAVAARWSLLPQFDAAARAELAERLRLGSSAPEYLPPPALAARGAAGAGAWERRLAETPRVRARPEGTRVEVLQWAPRRIVLAIEAAGPARVTLRRLYWKHLVGTDPAAGGRLALSAEAATGLAVLDAPAGARRVEIALPLLPSERLGYALSALAGLALAAGALAGRRRWRRHLSRLREREGPGPAGPGG